MKPWQKSYWIAIYQRHWLWFYSAQAALFLLLGILLARTFAPGVKSANEAGDVTDASQVASGSGHEGHDHGNADSADEVKWWTCAMHPQIRQQKPGKCPICRMDLVPVKNSSGGMRTLTITPAARALLQIQTSPVERKYVTKTVRLVGKIDYDETRVSHITAWVSGRLDRLFVDYTGVSVKQGDHMVSIYSEELYSIQEELLTALRFQKENPNAGGERLVDGAREKLRLLGLTDEQIRKIESRPKADDHVTIYSPASGIVINKLKNEGDRVRTGDRIYTVADLSTVWLKMDAYESDLQWLRYGQKVSFSVEAFPGEMFTGRVAFVDPILNQQTRTVKVRVNVDNSDGRLKPEMFARATVHSEVAADGRVMDAELAGKWISPMHPEIVSDKPGLCKICGMPLVRAETLGFVPASIDAKAKPLVVPASAVLVTGTRAIVYVEVENRKAPTFEGREILLGPRTDDYYLVRNGLFDGEKVVTHGNFKIDSALQIQAKPTMMTPDGGGGGGHHHGGHSPTKKDTSNPGSGKMQMELPKSFTQALQELVTGSERVAKTLKTGDYQEARQTFSELESRLNAVDASGLKEHPAMLWKEMLMRLGNDVIEGRQAPDIATAQRAGASLSRNIQRLKKDFMLQDQHDQPDKTGLPPIDAPVEFQRQVSVLLDGYFRLQDALAKDDSQRTSQLVGTFAELLKQIDAGLLSESAQKVWTTEAGQLQTVLERLQAVQDMEAARKEFALLSEQILVIVQRFGAGSASVFELHCPMAFDGRGATWLQPDKSPRNPYFDGPVMESCADRVRPIGANSATKKESAQ